MKKKKPLTVVLMLVLSIILMCSCGRTDVGSDPSKELPVSLVIIAGRHANANLFPESQLEKAEELLKRSIQETPTSTGYNLTAKVSVIVSDGNPQIASVDEKLLQRTATNSNDSEETQEKIVKDLIKFLRSDELRADDEEVDLLEAIRVAQKHLQSDGDYERHILILDTGITTAGCLNMSNINILDEKIDDIIDLLEDQIPQLDGIQITFLGLGNVAYPQCGLSGNKAEDRLVDLWTKILEKGNGTLTEPIFYSAPEGEPMMWNETPVDGEPGYPAVNAVIFVEDPGKEIIPNSIIISSDDLPLEKSNISCVLQSAHLGFKAESAEFRDIDQAIATINLVAPNLEQFLNETDYNIYVVGSIAKVVPNMNDRANKISLERAQAVCDLLVEKYNVPRDRLVPIDAGVTEFSWRNANEFPNGEITSETSANQAKNRVVALIGENSTSLVQELRDVNYIQ